jgi:hypothetical protein
VLSAPLRWDGTILKGIAITTAFPFVGRKLLIDPVRRLTHASLLKGSAGNVIKAPAKVLRRAGGAIRRPRLPF